MPRMYEMRSSVSRVSWPSPAFFHAKNVERDGLPSRTRASSALRRHASAMRKNVRRAAPDSRSEEAAGCGSLTAGERSAREVVARLAEVRGVMARCGLNDAGVTCLRECISGLILHIVQYRTGVKRRRRRARRIDHVS